MTDHFRMNRVHQQQRRRREVRRRGCGETAKTQERAGLSPGITSPQGLELSVINERMNENHLISYQLSTIRNRIILLSYSDIYCTYTLSYQCLIMEKREVRCEINTSKTFNTIRGLLTDETPIKEKRKAKPTRNEAIRQKSTWQKPESTRRSSSRAAPPGRTARAPGQSTRSKHNATQTRRRAAACGRKQGAAPPRVKAPAARLRQPTVAHSTGAPAARLRSAAPAPLGRLRP